LLNGFETWQIAAIVGSFFVAGLVKGTMGVGLPMVAVPLISMITGPASAIALMVVPNLSANGWQAVQAGHQGAVFRRFWPMLLALVAGSLVGAQLLVLLDAHLVAGILGIVILLFVALQVMPRRLTLKPKAERRLNVPVGLAAGVIGGASSFFGPIVILYLVALDLAKELFVSTVALMFFVGMAPMFASLAVHGILGWDELLASAVLGAVPVAAGLFIGRHLRKRIPQAVFKRVLLVILVLIAIGLIRESLG